MFEGEGEAKLSAPAAEGGDLNDGVMENSFLSIILMTLQNALSQHFVDQGRKSSLDCKMVRDFFILAGPSAPQALAGKAYVL